jgi:nuclear transport factor 2 (NTF2) superfamily protein
MDHRVRAIEVNGATYAAWNAHDADRVAAVFAEDAILREAGRADEIRGRDQAGLMAQLGFA